LSEDGVRSFEVIEVTLDAIVPLPESVTEAAISSLVRHVLSREDAEGEWTVGLQMTSDVEMQTMHLDFMGLDSPTDIMTFPHDGDAWEEPGASQERVTQGGDIVISVDQARDQAEDEGWDVAEEVFFLVCHGLLHLLDWDDASDSDRISMLNRQRELLSAWDRAAT